MSKQIYTATLYGPAIRTIEGTVVAEDANQITVHYKRPRSSKFEQAVIPRTNVQYAAVGEDGSVEIAVVNPRAELANIKVAPDTIEVKGNFTTFVAENGDTYVVANTNVSFVGEAEEAAKKKSKGGKAEKPEKGEKKKGKKGKKKVK